VKRFLVLVIILVIGLSLVSFGQQLVNIFPQEANVKYGGTLKLVMPWGPLTFNLNPFLPAGVRLGIIPELYESLFYINSLNGNTTPILGTNYKWEDNNLKLVVSVRQGVKWSDGTPFTAQDVAFTFNYIKKYPVLDMSGIWSDVNHLQSVAASGDTVTFTFSQPNTPLFYYIAGVLITPEHVWSTITNPSTYTNPNPVVTGPFLFKTFKSPDQIVAVKNPDYWMEGRPYVDQIVMQSVNSNTTTLLYMIKHEYDVSYLYIPDPQTAWVAKDPALNHYWWPTNNANILYLNTLKYPFDNPTFRRAISMAIDKNLLEKTAYFSTGGYDQNPTGIIPAQQKEWLDPTLESLAASLTTYNPKAAQQLLASIGFVKNSSGVLVGPDGKPLPTFKILVGAGWTDFVSMAEVISQELSGLGISTTIDQEPWNTYISSVMSATYDMVICWGTGTGPSPYFLYYQEFNPAFSASKIGETAISDYSRYTNPLITAALQVFSSTSNLSLQKQAMYTIERIVLEDVPFIVLTNRTNFFDYSTANFVGWPSNSNPYASGGNFDGSDGLPMSLNIHLK
jgi:peptide/nickel transport system substrate-binding protein